VPIDHGSKGSSDDHYATVGLLAFDAAGRFVPANEKGTMLIANTRWVVLTEPALNGAITPKQRAEYQPNIGTFRTPYYRDSGTFDVDLDALLGQGIRSVAVAMVADHAHAFSDRLAKFRRKAVRIVDPESKVEIAATPVVAPWVSIKWGMLVGGIVFVNDAWSWLPAGDLVLRESVPDYQARWYERMVQAQCVAPQ
jgi:hypothetical protein